MEFIELVPQERSRTYRFAGGDSITYKNVAKIRISDSGNHRLEYDGGKKAIVMVGWLAIDIDADKWTF